MQQMELNRGKSMMKWLATGGGVAAWGGGLLLAGSDGPMMPYVNVLGVLLFSGASLWLKIHLGKSGSRAAEPAADRLKSVRCKPTGIRRSAEAAAQGCTGHRLGAGYTRNLGMV